MAPLALGIDLGTSGVRIAVINGGGELLHTQSAGYRQSLVYPDDWITGITTLIQAIPGELRQRIRSIAVDGTSGT
ncbi:MAG: sugar kinase, partial [Synechococcus sp.]|nr:sugar kinase [Synechococcus sp.]